jgi:[acyl-carrier-protein] S-malonyltransferase
LGEISALCVAGVFPFKEGLEIVSQRGIFMEEECKKYEGGMMAVLGLDDENIENFCGDGVWAANYNCDGQLVLSGYKEK